MSKLTDLENKKTAFKNYIVKLNGVKENLNNAKNYLNDPENYLKVYFKIDKYDADRSSITKIKSKISDACNKIDTIISDCNAKITKINSEIEEEKKKEENTVTEFAVGYKISI